MKKRRGPLAMPTLMVGPGPGRSPGMATLMGACGRRRKKNRHWNRDKKIRRFCSASFGVQESWSSHPPRARDWTLFADDGKKKQTAIWRRRNGSVLSFFVQTWIGFSPSGLRLEPSFCQTFEMVCRSYVGNLWKRPMKNRKSLWTKIHFLVRL